MWLSEITGPVIYVDIEPAVLIQTLTAEVGVRGPDEKRRRLITVTSDPGMLV